MITNSSTTLHDSAGPAVEVISPRTIYTRLARNASLNLLTESFLFVVLLASTPFLVRKLGVQAFGLYALAWSFIGYLAYLEFGVSRSATQFVSKYLSLEDHSALQRVATTSILSNLVIGLACGTTVCALTPWLVDSVFHIPAELKSEARLVFFGVALAVPLVMLHSVLRAIAASFQAFTPINIVNATVTTSQYVLACFLAWKGCGVGIVVFSTVLVRMVFVCCYGVLMARLMPEGLRFNYFDRKELRNLLRFGGWVTASLLVLQFSAYLDRIFLASLVSLSAVTLFTVPYEGLTRLRMIPAGVMATVYPAMTETSFERGRMRLRELYANSVRYLFFLLLPLVGFLAIFGRDILTVWMGKEFASNSYVVFQIVALGFLLNAVAYVPYHVVQSTERPDIIGRYHLLVLPFYVAVTFLLVSHWGIPGAAAAACVRFGIDAAVLFWAAQRYCDCAIRLILGPSTMKMILLGSVLLVFSALLKGWRVSPWIHLFLGLVAVGVYFLLVWRLLLTPTEKPAIARALGLLSA